MAVASRRFDDLGADGAPRRLGLMGGTFDPIHNGHLRIAEEVREELALDAVLFIPTGNPVFKRGQHVTRAELRLERVRRAVEGNPHFDVSDIEVARGGDTYTVDTLRQLRGHYPDNVELYFIVGSDTAATVGKWRSCAELAELAHLVVAYGRPGSPGPEELAPAILEAAPFELHMVRVSVLEISSTDIRRRIDEGKSIRYLVPSALRDDIGIAARGKADLAPSTGAAGAHAADSADAADAAVAANGDDVAAAAADDDPLGDAFFEARKAELEQRVGPKRFRHSLGVSQACVQLAERYGLDVRKARIAGLLHDWDKGLDDAGARARVYELGMEDEIDPYVVETMPRVLHGITAARALGREFPGLPADVLQAVSRHTTAAESMSPLDMALYIADAIEPNRQFGSIDELRAAVGTLTLEELYFKTYEYWVFLLFERRQPLHPDTIRIWNSYAARLHGPYVSDGKSGDARGGAKAAKAGKPDGGKKTAKAAKSDGGKKGGKGKKAGKAKR